DQIDRSSALPSSSCDLAHENLRERSTHPLRFVPFPRRRFGIGPRDVTDRPCPPPATRHANKQVTFLIISPPSQETGSDEGPDHTVGRGAHRGRDNDGATRARVERL